VAPAKRGRAVHAHLCGGPTHAQTLGQRPGLCEPFPTLAQACPSAR
jgi:hypothetical protein